MTKLHQKLREAMLSVTLFFYTTDKNSNCRSAAVKKRTIENSSAALWESSPLISIDMAF
ncbi:hypothetical protein [Salmonella enterica]|uniref:hypothetical protein n=1 Tax=Salmonella enterica TaxID=28901 RepID=UPI0013B04E40|nr:hypothetical protein [Salmonella enterica]